MPSKPPAIFTPSQFARKMLEFYDQYGRKDLPWQKNPTPYRVWVSEIMLQQTQVKTVIPYYQKFIRRFKNIEQLAEASLDEVLHHWQGLGYYSRARNLHRCAQQIVAGYQGEFPASLAALESLPGIGRSTAGAILSLAMNQPEPILDGNVKRVLARVFLVEGWYGQAKVSKQLWALSEQFTPSKRTGNFNQAMMDLGASLCSRTKPDCQNCPLNSKCLAFQTGQTAIFPHKKPKKAIPTKPGWLWLSVNDKAQLLLEKRPPSGIWGGLISLPEANADSNSDLSDPAKYQPIAEIHHTFTHFKLHAKVYQRQHDEIITDTQVAENPRLQWHNIDDLESLAFPKPIKEFLFNYFQLNSE